MTEVEFKSWLKLYRKYMTPAQRRRGYRLVSKAFTYPIGTEREYARIIRKYQTALVQFVQSRLPSYLPKMISQAKGDIRLDGLSEELEAFMSELDMEVTKLYGGVILRSSPLFPELVAIAHKLFEKYKVKFEKEIAVVAGVPLKVPYLWWESTRDVWLNENYRIIKSLSSEYVTKLNTILVNGLQAGWSVDEFQSAIQLLSDKITGYRARLIARDQIGKLNSYINERQSRGIGMEFYIWRTSQDERVRGNPTGKYPRAIPDHFIMDDKFCTWNDSTIYSPDVGKTWVPRTARMEFLHPGRAISCRCLALPAWNIYLEDIDSTI